jgi:hypothetical protein
MHWVLALGAGAGHGRTRGKCGHIKRKGGGDMTRGDALAEAKAVGSRVAGRRPAGVRRQAPYRYRNTR